MRVTKEELAKKKADEAAAKAKLAESAEDEADEADDFEPPTDPIELAAYAKKIRKELRAAERELKKAGLSRKEERRLTDVVASMEAKLDTITEALAAADVVEEIETEEGDEPIPGPAAAVETDDCPFTIL